MASSNLYPPIVAHSMPAFAIKNQGDTTVRIYFALSSYNRRQDFQMAHVTVRYQQNNGNALDTEQYPAQIKICPVEEVTAEEDATIAATAYRYYITLSSNDLAQNNFIVDTTYKVQIRFSEDSNTQQQKLNYFSTYQYLFSEWSTVCLIRGIVEPTFFIIGLEDNSGELDIDDTDLVLSSVDTSFVISYTPGSQEETLYRWRVELYSDTKEQLADSGWTLFDSYNNIITQTSDSVSFETVLPYQMEDQQYYRVWVTIETKNGYIKTKKTRFQCSAVNHDPSPATIDAFIIEENGYALIQLRSSENVTTNITVRRSSSRSNFTIWEDIANYAIANEEINIDYCDFTIESGVWYRYGVQVRDALGRRGSLTMSKIVMGEFEDAFLVEKGESLKNAKQLKLRYDFQISNFVRTVAESKTDTIGSQYPFVRRNGNMYYREFQCSGLITAYMDEYTNLFTTKARLYNNNQERYKNVRDPIDYNYNQYDYTYEREFRKAVEEFLYNGKVKLFKSLQEGNILVKVMNVSLTPKQELGRLLYNFSATFVEVGEPTIENLNAYGLLTVGNYSPHITFDVTNKLGRLKNTPAVYSAGTNIMDLIKQQYSVGESINGIIVENLYLTHLKVVFNSDPYLINSRTARPIPKDAETISSNTDLVLGWLLQIGNNTILVEPPNNVYELKGDYVSIPMTTPIVPLADTEMEIDFITNLYEQQDLSHIVHKKIYRNINGQYINTFLPTEDIVKTLWYRYYIDYYHKGTNIDGNDQYKQTITVLVLDVEAEPGTILQAKSSAAQSPSTFVIGETGRLLLDPGSKEFSITNMKVIGTRIDARYLNNKYNSRSWDEMFVTQEGYENSTLKTFNDTHNFNNAAPENPIQYDYCNIDNQMQMYYKGQWYPVTIQQINGYNAIFDIQCPVDAIIYYFVQAEKGIY